MNKLPVFSTAKSIYKDTFSDLKRYFSLSAIWFVLIAIVTFFAYDAALEMAKAEFYTLLGYPVDNANILKIKAYAYSFGINILNVLLIGAFARSVIDNKITIALDTKTLKFLFKYMMLSLLGIIIFVGTFLVLTFVTDLIYSLENNENSILIISILGVIALISIIVSMFFILRLFLILPDTFMEQKAGFKNCWKATKSSVCRIFAVIAIIGIPSIILTLLNLINYTNVESGSAFSFEVMIFENRFFYVIYLLVVALFAPLYGTMMSKVYEALNPEKKEIK